jgi:N-acylneuraminate cytidylyltransferase
MIEWTIRICQESNIFSDVIVSTDDKEISAVSKKAGAAVIERPNEMATDTAHESLAYKHALEIVTEKPDYFCGIYPTAALIMANDLKKAYRKIQDTGADALMGVSSYPIHPFKALEETKDGYLRMVYPEICLKRSQEFPHYVASNGTFYFLKTEAFLKNPTYYQEKLTGYEVPPNRAVDVDTKEDFEMLELILSQRNSYQGL